MKRQCSELKTLFCVCFLHRLLLLRICPKSPKSVRGKINSEYPFAKALRRRDLSGELTGCGASQFAAHRFGASLYTCFTTLNTATLPDSMARDLEDQVFSRFSLCKALQIHNSFDSKGAFIRFKSKLLAPMDSGPVWGDSNS